MRKNDKFTIENGMYLYHLKCCKLITMVSLVRDNWKEVCDMSKPLVHTSLSGEILEFCQYC